MSTKNFVLDDGSDSGYEIMSHEYCEPKHVNESHSEYQPNF